MKKTTKILTILAGLALVIGILTVAAFASSTATPWEPEEGSGIYYAVWASEESYKAGDEPLKTNLSFAAQSENMLMQADLASLGDCYIRLYDDVKMQGSSGSTLASLQDVVIDLGDNTVYIHGNTQGVVKVGGYGGTSASTKCSLTFINGTVDITGQTQINGTGTLIFRNATVNAANQIGYDSGGQIYFYDSVLNARGNHLFDLGLSTSGAGIISFFNTDVVSTGDISTTKGLFFIRNGGAAHIHSITFDKDSSLTTKTETPLFAYLSASVAKSNIYLERGFTVSNSVITAAPGEKIMAVSNPNYCSVSVVEPGTKTPISAYIYKDNGDGTSTISLADWAWAIYANASDTQPILSSAEQTLTASALRQSGGKYLKLFLDTSLVIDTTDPLVTTQDSFLIDLSGKTLSADGPINLASDGNCSIAVNDGTLSAVGDLSVGKGNTLSFNGVTLNAASLKTASSLSFLSSALNLSASSPVVLGDADAELTFEKTTLNFSAVTITDAIFTVNGTAAAWNISFDGNTKLDLGVSGKTGFLALASAEALAELEISEGFTFSKNTDPRVMTVFDGTGYGETETPITFKNTAGTVTDDYILAAVGSSYSTLGTIKWAAYTSKEAYLNGDAAIATNYYDPVNIGAVIRSEFLNTLGDCYIIAFTDLDYISLNSANATVDLLLDGQDIVLDLNGKSLNVPASNYFKIGKYNSWYNCSLVMQNGKFTFSTQSQLQYGSTMTFDNMEINGNTLGYGSGANVYFVDSKITLSNSVPFSVGTNKDGQVISFKNTDLILTSTAIGTVNGDSFKGIFGFKQTYGGWKSGHAEIYFDKDSTMTSATENAVWIGFVAGTNSAYSSRGIEVYIEDGFTVSGLSDVSAEIAETPAGTSTAYTSIGNNVTVKLVDPDTKEMLPAYVVTETEGGKSFKRAPWTWAIYENTDSTTPLYTSEADVITASDLARGGKVLRLFKNVTVTLQDGEALIPTTDTYTVYLNGMTVAIDSGLALTADGQTTALSITGGTLSVSGTLSFGRGGSAAFNGVTVNAEALKTASSLDFAVSVLNLSGASPIVLFGHSEDSAAVSFLNTDLNLSSSSIAVNAASAGDSSSAIVTLKYTDSALSAAWSVRFDTDSFISAPNMTAGALWLAIDAAAAFPTEDTVKLLFEENILFTENAAPNSDYIVRTEGTGAFVAGKDTEVSASVDVVKLGTDTPISGWVKVDRGDGTFTVGLLQYAVYESEEAFLAGAEPIYTNYSDGYDDEELKRIRAEFINSLGSCYIRIYTDLLYYTLDASNQTVNLGSEGAHIVIDLCGNTLQCNGSFKLGLYNVWHECSCTMKNGSFIFSAQNQYQAGATMSFVNMTVTGTSFGYASGADVLFRDTTLTLSSSNPFFLGTVNNTQSVRFENTDLILTSTEIGKINDNKVAGIFGFGQTHPALVCNDAVIYFDAASTLKCATPNPLWLGINENNSRINSIKIVIEDGFTVKDDASVAVITHALYNPETASMDLKHAKAAVNVIIPEPYKLGEAYEAVDNGDGTFTFRVADWAWAIYPSESSPTPILKSNEATISNLDIRNSNGAYLRLYKDVILTLAPGADTAGNDFILPAVPVFKINLGGNTLTLSSSFVFMADGQGTALSVESGTLSTGGAVVLGFGNSASFTAVNITATELSTASPVSFVQSTLNLSSAAPIVLGGFDASLGTALLKFADTDLNLSSSAIATGTADATVANAAIITFRYTDAQHGADWTVHFDTNSVVYAPNMTAGAVWLAVIEDAALPADTAIALYFEESFTFTEFAAPNFNYLTRPVGTESFVDKNDALAAVAKLLVVKLGTFDEAVGFVTVKKSETLYTVGLIQWAVYPSREAYIAGEAPIHTNYTDGFDDEALKYIRAEFINTLGDCYIVAFTDIGYYAKFVNDKGQDDTRNLLQQGQDVVINLNGNTLTNVGAFKIGLYGAWHKCSLTIEDGTWLINAQTQFQKGATLVLDGVHLKSTASIGYGSGADMYFVNSTLEISSYLPFSFGNSNGLQTVSFENTDLILTSAEIGKPDGNKVAGIFGYHQGWDKWVAELDIRLDKNSSISAPKGSLWIGIKETYGSVAGINLYVEEGCAVSEGLLHDVSTMKYDATAQAYVDVSDVAFIKIVRPGETEEPLGVTLYAKYTGEGDLAELLFSRPVEGIAWYIVSDLDFVLCIPVKTAEGVVGAVMTKDDLLALRDGSLITLNCDTVLVDTDIISGLANRLVFDLSGHKLTLSATLDLSGEGSRVFTVKNGEISALAYLFTGELGADGVLTLSGVKISADFAGDLIALGSGSLVLDSVEVNAPNATVFNLTLNGSADLEYTLTDCNITADKVFVISRGDAADNRLVIKLSGSFVTGTLVASTDASELVTVVISETYLSEASAFANIEYAKGEKLMTLPNNAAYPYRVTLLNEPLRANLVLSSDLTVRFYIPVNTNISELKIGGVTYKVSELTEKINIFPHGEHYVITFAELTPDVAAELVEYSLTFTKDGDVHVADTAYSVLDYVASVLDSDLNFRVKELAVAVTEYIAAAYAHEGRENGELQALMTGTLYLKYKPETVTAAPDTGDMSAVADAVRSVQLNLESGMKMRFNILSGYTGTLTVAGKSYSVTDGVADGLTYVEVELPAHLMYNTVIHVSTDSASAAYTLNAYVSYVQNSSTPIPDVEKALVLALYNYCYYAAVYETAAGN